MNNYIIVGKNQEQIDFNINNILEGIDYQSDNLIEYDMSISTLNDIIDEASMISLFGGNKIIKGINFDMNKISNDEYDYLSKYLNNINKSIFIILVTNKIDNKYKLFIDKFKVIEIDKSDNLKDLFIYFKDKIKNNGYKIDDKCLEYLISKVNNNYWELKNELDKLYMYKVDDKIINRDDIDLLVMENIDNVIYEFTNAVLEQDYDKITRMYNKFMEDNVSIDYLLVSLDNSFRQSLIIKCLYNQGKNNSEIAKVIGKKEFFVKKSLERLYKYTENDLADFINKLAIIDRDNKSGKSNFDMLEILLYK